MLLHKLCFLFYVLKRVHDFIFNLMSVALKKLKWRGLKNRTES